MRSGSKSCFRKANAVPAVTWPICRRLMMPDRQRWSRSSRTSPTMGAAFRSLALASSYWAIAAAFLGRPRGDSGREYESISLHASSCGLHVRKGSHLRRHLCSVEHRSVVHPEAGEAPIETGTPIGSRIGFAARVTLRKGSDSICSGSPVAQTCWISVVVVVSFSAC